MSPPNPKRKNPSPSAEESTPAMRSKRRNTRPREEIPVAAAEEEMAEEPDASALEEAEWEEKMEDLTDVTIPRRPERKGRRKAEKDPEIVEPPQQDDCQLLERISKEKAFEDWPHRYPKMKRALDKGASTSSHGVKNSSLEVFIEAQGHFKKAMVDGIEFELGDDAFVKGEEGKPDYICKIIELFMGVDNIMYFRARWFYRAEDTVISEVHKELVPDEKRLFFSEMQDDNSLDCLVKKIKISCVPHDINDLQKKSRIEASDFYFDQHYLLPHCTFLSVGTDNHKAGTSTTTDLAAKNHNQHELTVLDLYAGCGAMSTGLCYGSSMEGVNLVTKWALDFNEHACNSLRINHPETEVRNEDAKDFLELLQEWKLICSSFALTEGPPHPVVKPMEEEEIDDQDSEDEVMVDEDDSGVYEVDEVVAICYGSPDGKKRGLYFKVKWIGYGPEEDSWEPFTCLSCPAKLKVFIMKTFEEKRLPLPGSVDIVCGGPPCQGMSGFNRYRNRDDPLADPKNQQMKVYMDIVQFLQPRYVLMENVVDLFRFSDAYLGRYAYARLVQMRYQARLGLMAAGSYGLAQYRMRAFLWAALPAEKLPMFPLPTHDALVRGNPPVKFQQCFVGLEEGSVQQLQARLNLGDCLSDLPPVSNEQPDVAMDYDNPPLTNFQRSIRLRRNEMPGSVLHPGLNPAHRILDHKPLMLNLDDRTRVGLIPKIKGACFRDLPGVEVRDNVAYLDHRNRKYLPSGKPLVPDYTLSFVKGTSKKPFGRLWYDETVPTVVTRAEPHNQIILHPHQDRVLTIRENARLQGFPDFYRLSGPVKERYTQVGNAVAIPVARALGHALALAVKGEDGSDPVYALPHGYPFFP